MRFDYFSDPPDWPAIAIVLEWADGTREARIALPNDLATNLAQLGYPAIDERREAESVISYGVFLALKGGLPLVITGDRSVWWQGQWPELIAA